MTVAARLRSLVGAAAEATATDGTPRAAPTTVDGCALVLAEASRQGWRVRLEGRGHWSPGDAPADLVLSARGLTAITGVATTDLVATAEAGVPWATVRQTLAARGAWIPLDPPGPDRTVGSVIATATAGPLRAGFGPVRDHLLGLTIVTGDGRVLSPGGRVAKNVAGYDLTRLAAGSFGAFGLVAAVHLRLRITPQADRTLTATGSLDALWQAAVELARSGAAPAALELLSPAAGKRNDWTLAIRLVGTAAAVDAQRRAIAATRGLNLADQATGDAPGWWDGLTPTGPVTLRLGVLPAALRAALDLVARHLDTGWVTASVAAGGLRWSGSATSEQLRRLRHAAAQLEMPLTLERAPWNVATHVGHWGAYHEGVAGLVQGLRRVFDPAGILVVPEET
jgi:glycolate oxidase FAD binding subunit